MEPGEIDESEITKSNESEPSRSQGRKGRYKARRQHKGQQTETSLPFQVPKRIRLETHLQRNEPVPKRLPASGHHAILNPSYSGTETPRWAAFRLSKVIKEDSLENLETGVGGLSKFGIRHSMGHKAKILHTRIRHLKKEIAMRQRQFIDIYDDIFGQKPRKLVHQMDPTTARSMSFNHRRISRLLKLEQPKSSSKPHFRTTKRFKKSHQYLKIRPPARKRKAISLRMGGMGTTMAITPSSDQGKQWHLPQHAHSESYYLPQHAHSESYSRIWSSTDERILYNPVLPWSLYYPAPSRARVCDTDEAWRCCWCSGRPACPHPCPRDRARVESGYPSDEVKSGSDRVLDGRANRG
jgi:hypothetical protein